MSNKYAILGATGQTGSSILSLLSASPTSQINLLVRSKEKLASISPSYLTNPNITIYESTISDIPTLAKCLSGIKAAFLTVAVQANIPGCSIATDTAHAVVAALNGLHKNLAPMEVAMLELDQAFGVGQRARYLPEDAARLTPRRGSNGLRRRPSSGREEVRLEIGSAVGQDDYRVGLRY